MASTQTTPAASSSAPQATPPAPAPAPTPSPPPAPAVTPATAATTSTSPAPAAPAVAAVASHHGVNPGTAHAAPSTPIQIEELTPALELVTIQIPAPQAPDGSTSDHESEKATAAAAAGTTTMRSRRLLRATDATKPYLPGQPRVRLDSCSSPSGPDDNNYLLEYLRKAHLTDELDGLLPFMKYIFVQTPSHKHIMALHHQRAHGREIVVNEHPGLHLVWYYERIFVKPIPAYMYSQAFWRYLHDADPGAYAAALGFMRSWYYLVQYEIDFQLAVEQRLIPKTTFTAPTSTSASVPSSTPNSNNNHNNNDSKKGEEEEEEPRHPTYEEFCRLMAPFRHVDDASVNRRYRFGELRLTRINKTTMLFRGKLAYFHIHPQWGSYLSHIIAPVVTVFAILSVVLNALQVTLASQQVGPDNVSENWWPFLTVSLYFPVAVILLVTTIVGLGVVAVLIQGVKDLVWTKSVRMRRKRGDMGVGEKSYGLIW